MRSGRRPGLLISSDTSTTAGRPVPALLSGAGVTRPDGRCDESGQRLDGTTPDRDVKSHGVGGIVPAFAKNAERATRILEGGTLSRTRNWSKKWLASAVDFPWARRLLG